MTYVCRFCGAETISFNCDCQNRILNKFLWVKHSRVRKERQKMKEYI